MTGESYGGPEETASTYHNRLVQAICETQSSAPRALCGRGPAGVTDGFTEGITASSR